MKGRSGILLLILLILPCTISCTKEDPISTNENNDIQGIKAKNLPVIQDTHVNVWSPVTAIAVFNVTDDGGAPLLFHGVCWNTSKYPTTNDFSSKVHGGFSKDSQYFVTGLLADTKYYLRAFAANDLGTAYGEQVSFTTPDIINEALPYGQVIDVDGNQYRTIQIGSQEWMAENLKTTQYNDSSPIQPGNGGPAGYTTWFDLGVGAYCWYDNDFATNNGYGALYNWHAVNTGKLCPEGWHVPTLMEWNLLVEWLGGTIGAFSDQTENGLISWGDSHVNIFDCGFAPVELGCLYGWGFVRFPAYWWTSTPRTVTYSTVPWAYIFSFDIEAFEPLSYGFSVRCIRN